MSNKRFLVLTTFITASLIANVDFTTLSIRSSSVEAAEVGYTPTCGGKGVMTIKTDISDIGATWRIVDTKGKKVSEFKIKDAGISIALRPGFRINAYRLGFRRWSIDYACRARR